MTVRVYSFEANTCGETITCPMIETFITCKATEVSDISRADIIFKPVKGIILQTEVIN